jgi:hypothetical protein
MLYFKQKDFERAEESVGQEIGYPDLEQDTATLERIRELRRTRS